MPTLKGASSRAASAATSASSGLVANGPWFTSMTFSGQTTRSTGSVIWRVAARWRSNTSRGSVSAARVPCGPPPCTKATVSESPVSWPDGATAPSSDEHHGHRGEHGRLAPRALPRRGQRAAGEEGEPGDEDDAAQPGGLAQRRGGLADAQRRQRHAAEGPDEADRLGHGEGGREREAAPAPGRGDRRRQAEVGGVGRHGHDVAGRREEPHPAHAGAQPAEPEEPRPGEAGAPRPLGHQPVEDGDADEGQRPPAPRREGEGDEGAGPERGGTGRRRAPCEVGHGAARLRCPPAWRRRCSAPSSTPAGGRRRAWPCAPCSG